LSLRGLLVITGIVAGLFVIAYSIGYEEALGILLTLVLFTWAVRCRRRGVFLPLRYLAAVLGIGTLWMVAVDRSWIREMCPDCYLDRDICQWRLFRIPLHESVLREYDSPINHIATDLGVPCSHQFHREHMSRYWGLFFPAHPCFNGIVRLVGEEWYDKNVSEIVRAKGRTSPGLAQEYHQKAIVEHDHAYRQQFCEELIRLKEHSTTQPKSQIVPDRRS
jgi:hypothetical protein